MAQRTIHILFATLLSEKIEISDRNRFLLGSILPDAYAEPASRKAAHFMARDPEENHIWFDFHSFSDLYKPQILNDDLYLGYYAHLIEDAFYRFFLYYEKDLMSRISKYDLTFLHSDYHLLNSYITEKYDLPDHLELPANFSNEPIRRITDFNVEKAISDYENDLVEKAEGQTKFLTERILEEFIAEYTDILANELRSIKQGVTTLHAGDYQWENKK